MKSLPTDVVLLNFFFDFFSFYQQKHYREFNGASRGYYHLLENYCFLSVVFEYGFLIYWGVKFGWISAGALFVLGFIGSTLLTMIEVVIPMRAENKIALIGALGMITVPILGYFLIQQVI